MPRRVVLLEGLRRDGDLEIAPLQLGRHKLGSVAVSSLAGGVPSIPPQLTIHFSLLPSPARECGSFKAITE
jgi:hypothetical protein